MLGFVSMTSSLKNVCCSDVKMTCMSYYRRFLDGTVTFLQVDHFVTLYCQPFLSNVTNEEKLGHLPDWDVAIALNL